MQFWEGKVYKIEKTEVWFLGNQMQYKPGQSKGLRGDNKVISVIMKIRIIKET